MSNPERLLAAAEQFKNQLLAHVQQEAGENWSVSILDGSEVRKGIDELLGFRGKDENLHLQSKDERKGGKRAGSSGDAIVREKFVMCLTNDSGEIQKVEISIYPFESANTEDVAELGKAGYWGWGEKVLDDYQGTYKGMRILSRNSKTPTEPSFYELLYPPRLYKRQAASMKKHVKSKKYPAKTQ